MDERTEDALRNDQVLEVITLTGHDVDPAKAVAPQQHHAVLDRDGTPVTVDMQGWLLFSDTDAGIAGSPRIIAETAETGGNLAVHYPNGDFQRYSTVEIAAKDRGFDAVVVLSRIQAIDPRHPLATAAARQAAYTAAVAALDPAGPIATNENAREELWAAIGAVADAGLLR